jgi:hypothetical protein
MVLRIALALLRPIKTPSNKKHQWAITGIAIIKGK